MEIYYNSVDLKSQNRKVVIVDFNDEELVKVNLDENNFFIMKEDRIPYLEVCLIPKDDWTNLFKYLSRYGAQGAYIEDVKKSVSTKMDIGYSIGALKKYKYISEECGKIQIGILNKFKPLL